MRKQTITYASPVDALVALVRQLSAYENQYRMDSAEFFTLYNKGELGDDEIFVEWSGNYQHYLGIKQELDEKLQDAA